MTIGILGTKVGMTQIFDEFGFAIPVTVIKAGPCVVTQIKQKEKEGYNAVQIGYAESSPQKMTKPRLGHLTKSNLPPLRHLKEYRVDSTDSFTISQKIGVDLFQVGQNINVSGTTIGKGFAGTVKRHHFTRGPMTHGSKNHREPGSIGQGSTPAKVHKGKKMAGRLGGSKATIKNLEVIYVNSKDNLLVIKGSVPGKSGNLLSIS
jgi:large subunit ribosomal protein L3|tara:strand:- start:732 stop:1346 length:615 start_codon:yes stop_codon:yes gene_type:complete